MNASTNASAIPISSADNAPDAFAILRPFDDETSGEGGTTAAVSAVPPLVGTTSETETAPSAEWTVPSPVVLAPKPARIHLPPPRPVPADNEREGFGLAPQLPWIALVVLGVAFWRWSVRRERKTARSLENLL